MGLDEETITLIAGETAESQTERKRATEKLKSLVEGKKALIRVQRQNPAGKSSSYVSSAVSILSTDSLIRQDFLYQKVRLSVNISLPSDRVRRS